MNALDIAKIDVELRHLRQSLTIADTATTDLNIDEAHRDEWRATFFEYTIRDAVRCIGDIVNGWKEVCR